MHGPIATARRPAKPLHTEPPLPKDFLRSHPKFLTWSARTLERFEEAAVASHYAPGAVIHDAGTPATDVYVLVRGVVETFTAVSSGEHHSAAFWHPGVILGLPAVFMEPRSRRRQTWIAHTEAECWRVPIPVVQACFWDDRGMAEAVLRTLGGRILWLTEELARATLLSAESKVLAKLLTLHDAQSPAGDGPMHPIQMTQAKLAEILGLTRQSVGRCLKSMEARGLIRINRFSIELRSIDHLRRYALECGAGHGDAGPAV